MDETNDIDLVKLRERLGSSSKPISQAELATRLGSTQSTISRIETGELKLDGPLAILIRQLAESVRLAA